MDGMGAGIAGLPEHLLRLNDLVDRRPPRVWLGVDHVDPRRPQARNDQVATFEESMTGERRQCRGAGIPTEMVKLVTLVRHYEGVDDLAVLWRPRINLDNAETVRLGKVRAE